MTYYYEELEEVVGKDYRKAFKSVEAAATHGCNRHNVYGYFRCERREKYRCVDAEVRKDGKVLGFVWH